MVNRGRARACVRVMHSCDMRRVSERISYRSEWRVSGLTVMLTWSIPVGDPFGIRTLEALGPHRTYSDTGEQWMARENKMAFKTKQISD